MTIRYYRQKLIDSGSYGRVFLAWDRQTKTQVVIKEVSVKHYVDMFKEIYFLRRMHKSCPKYFTGVKQVVWNREKKKINLIMDYYPGTLTELIRFDQENCFLLTIAQQVLEAYAAMEQHLVCHFDMKPDNILVEWPTKALAPIIKVIDFGFMEYYYPKAKSSVVCTDYYRAPELFKHKKTKFGIEVDLWSIGCIFAEYLKKDYVFTGEEDDEIYHKLMRKLPKLPYHRYDQVHPLFGYLVRSFLSLDPEVRIRAYCQVRRRLIRREWLFGPEFQFCDDHMMNEGESGETHMMNEGESGETHMMNEGESGETHMMNEGESGETHMMNEGESGMVNEDDDAGTVNEGGTGDDENFTEDVNEIGEDECDNIDKEPTETPETTKTVNEIGEETPVDVGQSDFPFGVDPDKDYLDSNHQPLETSDQSRKFTYIWTQLTMEQLKEDYETFDWKEISWTIWLTLLLEVIDWVRTWDPNYTTPAIFTCFYGLMTKYNRSHPEPELKEFYVVATAALHLANQIYQYEYGDFMHFQRWLRKRFNVKIERDQLKRTELKMMKLLGGT